MVVPPYEGVPQADWSSITQNLVQKFPIKMPCLCEFVHSAWNDIYASSFKGGKWVIGKDIFLPAQATGVILEKLIAVHMAEQFPKSWRGGKTKSEKDIICCDNRDFSFEIKTSSSVNGLYGNRSTGYEAAERTKTRAGYYLVINYKLPDENDPTNFIRQIRFGWIDDKDWVGQSQPTGQQASIGAQLAKLKLLTIFKC